MSETIVGPIRVLEHGDACHLARIVKDLKGNTLPGLYVDSSGHNLHLRSPLILDALLKPELVATQKWILNRPVEAYLWRSHAYFNRPGGPFMDQHSDDFRMFGGPAPGLVANAWIALTGTTLETCLWFDDHAVLMDAGEAIVFDGTIKHGTKKNTKSLERIALSSRVSARKPMHLDGPGHELIEV